MYKIIGADGKEYGPVNAEQIRQWIAEGRLRGPTRVQADGETGWKTLAQFPEFGLPPAPLVVTPPPAVPGAVKVFGVLNIVFGALGLLCSPVIFLGLRVSSKFYGHSPLMMKWLVISSFLSVIGAIILLASGIGLCQRRSWARKLAVGYAVFALIVTAISTVLTIFAFNSNSSIDDLQRVSGIIGGVIGGMVTLVYNGLLIFYLNQAAVKRALDEIVD